MKKAKTLISILSRLFILMRFGSLYRFFFKRSFSAKYIIWVPKKFSLNYLASDNLIKDFFFFDFLEKRGEKVITIKSPDEILEKESKIILFNPSRNLYSNSENYSEITRNYSERFQNEFQHSYPTLYESSYWENKIFMHSELYSKKIPTPKTQIIKFKDITYEKLSKFFKSKQFLIKEVHSSSAKGVHIVRDQSNIDLLNTKIPKSMKVITQELINMRRDLRVILVGGNIVLHYWRINNKCEWQPTSTSYGSSVDFENFPIKWKDEIEDYFKRLNIISGAFDICWHEDDLSTVPLVLEISTFFQPNPKKGSGIISDYGEWKNTISLKEDGYLFKHINQIKEIQNKILKEILRKYSL